MDIADKIALLNSEDNALVIRALETPFELFMTVVDRPGIPQQIIDKIIHLAALATGIKGINNIRKNGIVELLKENFTIDEKKDLAMLGRLFYVHLSVLFHLYAKLPSATQTLQ